MKKFIMTILLVGNVAFAGNDGGGGNGVGNQLFDFYENAGTEVFNVQETSAYKKVLEPLFLDLDRKLPDLSAYLKEGLDHQWLLEPKKLNSELCTNTSLVSVKKQVIACQTDLEVRVSKTWFESADLNNQAGLIIHELLRYQSLNKDNHLTDQKINYLTRAIMNAKAMTESDLQALIAKGGLYFKSTSDEKLVNQVIRNDFYPMFCNEIEENSASSLVSKIFDAARDLRYTTAQHGYFIEKGSQLRNIMAVELRNYDSLTAAQKVCEAALN